MRHAVARFENGRFVAVSGVTGAFAFAIAGDEVGNLWISQGQGLLHLRRGTTIERIPWATFGQADHASALAVDPQGDLWVGLSKGGVARFKDGQLRGAYRVADGLGEGRVTGFQPDRDNTLWVATQGGLSRVRDGRVATLTSKNGLPCDSVHWVMADDAHALWLGTVCGLVQITRDQLETWTATADKDPKWQIQTTVFDDSDGIRNRAAATGYSPRVSRAPDGRLWFLSGDGVSVIDPRNLRANPLPPPVHIHQLIADRKSHDAASGLRLPPLIRDLQIDYAALSLAAPDKNRFRVKLEGWDPDWRDVGNRRQAFYNNLPPRHYTFRVIASNNSGVWNEVGASLDFSIAPAYYQTRWFQASLAAAALALLWAAYQSRARRIAHEFDLRLEERVSERTRVARELHDTLLQTFHGVLFRFQAAANMLPERPAEAKQAFESAIDRAAQAITDGRDAIQDLRASTVLANDLAVAISTLGDELGASAANGNRPAVHVAVHGTPRDFHPILRDDIYRIAGEALRNAFRHAHARRIEVDLTYNDRQFRLQVRDDGRGIDPAVLAEERHGHFGLPGMRERAQLVGGRFDVWSEAGVGTEIDLTIPAAEAYAAARAYRRAWSFGKRTRRDA
jgi:signal transduction histidine kinase